MSAPERVYRLLLRAYPPAFRAAYGREMLLLFRDQRRHRATDAGADARFWAAMLWDVARSAPALRLDALRARWRGRRRVRIPGPRARGPHLQREGGTMTARRAVAMLAVVGGVFEAINTGVEYLAGRGASRGDGGWLLAVALGVALGAVLAAAGVALLRGGAGATRAARVAAIACLALLLGVQLAFPFMSIFALLLGVALPVALLLAARRPSDGASMPSVA